MKILLITQWKHLNEVTGADKAFCALSSALSRHHDVTALALTQTGNETLFFPLSPAVHFINITGCYELPKPFLHSLFRVFKGGKLARHRYDQNHEDPQWVNKMKPVIDKVRPDVIIAFTLDLARMLLFYANLSCPVVLTLRQSADVALSFLTPESRTALEKVACIHVLMNGEIAKVKARANCRKVIRIPNSVIHAGLSSTLTNKVVIHSGRFSKNQKRQHLLIEALHLIHSDFPDWKLEFWGEGSIVEDPYAKYCFQLVKQYHLEDNVSFCGVTKSMAEKMAKASIFAFPSATEGMSQALLEAMDVGLPVIGYRSCPSVREMISDGINGLLVDDGVEPLADALRQLMGSLSLRQKLGAAAKKVKDDYAPDAIWQQWETLLEDITAKQV